jgi:hypothetical protein
MFFAFIKMVIGYLLFRTLISDGYNIYSNLMQGCHKGKHCIKGLMVHSSIFGIDDTAVD